MEPQVTCEMDVNMLELLGLQSCTSGAFMDNRLGLDAFEEVDRLIIVAAHPDDLETLCGGTVALLVERRH